jgi:hypothetical protein
MDEWISRNFFSAHIYRIALTRRILFNEPVSKGQRGTESPMFDEHSVILGDLKKFHFLATLHFIRRQIHLFANISAHRAEFSRKRFAPIQNRI